MSNPDDIPTYEFDLPADPNDPAAWDIQPDTLAPSPEPHSRWAWLGWALLALLALGLLWALFSGHVIAL